MLSHSCQILQECAIFEGTNTGAATFLKDPSNIVIQLFIASFHYIFQDTILLDMGSCLFRKSILPMVKNEYMVSVK